MPCTHIPHTHIPHTHTLHTPVTHAYTIHIYTYLIHTTHTQIQHVHIQHTYNTHIYTYPHIHHKHGRDISFLKPTVCSQKEIQGLIPALQRPRTQRDACRCLPRTGWDFFVCLFLETVFQVAKAGFKLGVKAKVGFQFSILLPPPSK